ncbi:hypothetical protein SLEP1_g15851 [Rubroshorea leprosula]|uniref:non-specific serine/threonine protein kinase n=1 Tax=Rubroshorea leprosula TaxID=152421 RepID=A0AAV5INV5_9ROSI|nr:hypothetical protein SLEP1_g15851 [Rubroshorea leprosula]
MSKMKHLLRKLHIGGGLNEHQRLGEAGPVISSPSPGPSPSSASTGTTSSTPSGSGSGSMGRIGTAESAGGDRTAGAGIDFGLLEEEFQMQLALAISASEPETAQIDSAKRISLAGSNNDALVEFLSLRYWSYNVVNYNEKILDGFYDVCGITSSSVVQRKMPSLVDLQAISVLDNVDYEVILVNRLLDPQLQELERRVYNEYCEYRASGHGTSLSGLIQKIADIVVNRMGGPVGDAEEMMRMWNLRSIELRKSLNTVILPLGCLDVGISRHRALLFKVLADRIGLPCMLIKRSYYTGTDDGAVNLIKIDDESEYIIDLMGAPGTLIPAEVPSSHLPNSGSFVRCFTDLTEVSKDSSLLHGKGMGNTAVSPTLDQVPKIDNMILGEAIVGGNQRNADGGNLAGRSEHEFGKIFSLPQLGEGSSGTHEKPSCAQRRKVNNVSKYVISAAKDPEFAQKLHAVLLESGASPPPDLFMDINSQDLGELNMIERVNPAEGRNVDNDVLLHSNKLSLCQGPSFISSGLESSDDVNYGSKVKPARKHQRESKTTGIESNVSSSLETTSEGYLLVGNVTSGELPNEAVDTNIDPKNVPSERQTENPLFVEDRPIRRISNNIDFNKESPMELMVTPTDLHIASNGSIEKINQMPREVAECEIQWEDLQIGERIGIGSYGEVYRADWNSTEVAVKKFLDQDFSGDALVQFKCEVEIMLRMRHPNVVLFMGAVTRSPHLSILTEFLPRGSLYKLLHRPNPQLDEMRRMRMALDVAKGMNYLHTSHPPIVHRDLKSPNLLVDKNWVVKVCDFGLSRLKHHTFLSSKSTAGTPEWMAPEVLRNEPANEKCDVYSFGVILWELVTLRIPWKGLNPMQVVGAVGFQNRRLEIPDSVDPSVAQIIRECWHTESHLRPSFAQLMSWLRHLLPQFIDRSNSGNLNIE